jgi:polyketide synthase 12/myxalamid-type polyketide synthase MxaB
MAARLDDANVWSARGIDLIAPREGMEVLDRILGTAPAQIMVLPIDWPHFLAQLPPGVTVPLLADLASRQDSSATATDAAGDSGALLAELAQLPEAARRDRLQEVIEQHLLRVLGMSAATRIDPRQPLNDVGVDSLMAVELRNALARAVGRKLPATLLFDYPNVAALTTYVAEQVLDLPSARNGEPPAAESEATLVEAVDALSAAELEASLHEELTRAGY